MINDMTAKDFWNYHRAQADVYHKKAQQAREIITRFKSRYQFVDALKAECRMKEFRNTRDDHKAKAREYRALM